MKSLWTKLVLLFRKLIDFIFVKEKEMPDAASDFDIKALLNTIYKNPQLIKEIPYDYLYGDFVDYFSQLLTSLENQWEQIHIDYSLGFIAKDIYEKRVSEFDASLRVFKDAYLRRLEII